MCHASVAVRRSGEAWNLAAMDEGGPHTGRMSDSTTGLPDRYRSLRCYAEQLQQPVSVLDRHGYGFGRRRRLDALDVTARGMRAIAERMAERGAGSRPGTWGSLSAAPSTFGQSLYLEASLRRVARPGRVDAATGLLLQLPDLRAEAGTSPDANAIRARVDEMVLTAMTDLIPGSTEWKLLLRHLPGDKRPLPPSIAGMEDPDDPLQPLITDIRTTDTHGPHIWLSDILVQPELRGRGIASAALQHLTRFADHHQLAIRATFDPAGFLDADTIARWYRSAGFATPDSSWRPGAVMHRAPTTP